MNPINEIISIVGKTAPLLATVLGGPLSGMVLSLIAALFKPKGNLMQDLLDALKSDHFQIEKLKQLENTHKEELEKIAATNYQTEVDDRKDARKREISLHDWVPTILALGFLLNYAAIQFYCVTHNNSINDIISARFQDVLIMIISYYFGSKHFDKNKN
jgi:hypothetical protein